MKKCPNGHLNPFTLESEASECPVCGENLEPIATEGD